MRVFNFGSKSKFALVANVAVLGSLVPQSMAVSAFAGKFEKNNSTLVSDNIEKIEELSPRERQRLKEQLKKVIEDTKKFLSNSKDYCLNRASENPEMVGKIKTVKKWIQKGLTHGVYGEETSKDSKEMIKLVRHIDIFCKDVSIAKWKANITNIFFVTFASFKALKNQQVLKSPGQIAKEKAEEEEKAKKEQQKGSQMPGNIGEAKGQELGAI